MRLNKRGRHSLVFSPKSDKRGAEMAPATVGAIVLVVLLIVVLAIGLLFGWESFAPWLNKENVDDVVKGCQVACSTQATYNFCSQPRTLIDGSKNEYKDISCNALIKIPETSKYGVVECTNIDCGAFTLGTDAQSCTTGATGYFETKGQVKTFKAC